MRTRSACRRRSRRAKEVPPLNATLDSTLMDSIASRGTRRVQVLFARGRTFLIYLNYYRTTKFISGGPMCPQCVLANLILRGIFTQNTYFGAFVKNFGWIAPLPLPTTTTLHSTSAWHWCGQPFRPTPPILPVWGGARKHWYTHPFYVLFEKKSVPG